MLTIVKPREVKTETAYRRIFKNESECYGFHCDKDGYPIFRGKWEEKLFDKCFEKPNRYFDCGRVERKHATVYPAIGICECGRKIVLSPLWGKGYALCECKRRYKADGSEII